MNIIHINSPYTLLILLALQYINYTLSKSSEPHTISVNIKHNTSTVHATFSSSQHPRMRYALLLCNVYCVQHAHFHATFNTTGTVTLFTLHDMIMSHKSKRTTGLLTLPDLVTVGFTETVSTGKSESLQGSTYTG